MTPSPSATPSLSTLPSSSNTAEKPVYTLATLAELLNARLVGAGDYPVSRVCHPLDIHSANDLVFAVEPAALAALKHPLAQAAIVAEGMEASLEDVKGYLVVSRPRVALAKALSVLSPLPKSTGTHIHPMAIVDPTATIHPTAEIGPFTVVGAGTVIGERVVVRSHVSIAENVTIGNDCILYAGVRVGHTVTIGNRVILQHNASIGADGFSFVTPEMSSIESALATGGSITHQNTDIIRMNSAGTVILEDDVEIGACSTVDRATLGATRIKQGTKVDNLVIVAHNVTVGENCLIAAQTGVAGSCKVGDRAVLAGQVGVKDHTNIGDDAIVLAHAGVSRDVPAKTVVGGYPAVPQREWFQHQAYTHRLKGLFAEVRALKQELASLKAEKSPTTEG